MPISDMYDFLPDAAPDYAGAGLSLPPDAELEEVDDVESIRVHRMLDGSEVRIELGGGAGFLIRCRFETLYAGEAGEVFDLYHNPAKANRQQRTFKWTHPTDGHVYVARFAAPLPRTLYGAGVQGLREVRLRVVGRVPDA